MEEIKPPALRVGVLGWARKNLFNTPFNTVLTLGILYALYRLVPPTVQWALMDSVWFTGSEGCKDATGACWSIIPANLRFIIFGFYPQELQWRPLCAMIMMVALLFYSKERKNMKRSLVYIWLGALFVMGLLMRGGLFGLPVVESAKWSGFPLTMVLSVFALAGAYPLGVALALGRQAKMPAIKTLCVIYIEMIRGVPLISLLFMSAVMFPLFLPEGITINKIIRAQVAMTMFTAAYIAEVVRGGLQALPKGQYEAADSLGLNYFQTMRLIILPQALKIVIPPTVGILVGAFKDTSLVVIIALYDVLKTTQSVLSNPNWMGYSTEAYIFIALIYFVCCFAMSSYSRRLERELHT